MYISWKDKVWGRIHNHFLENKSKYKTIGFLLLVGHLMFHLIEFLIVPFVLAWISGFLGN